MILRVKDKEGNIQEIIAIRGEDGKDYVLTEEDKQEIANIVIGAINAAGAISETSEITEERVLELINANMPASGEEVDY